MIEERFEAILNRRVDGESSAAEEAELREYLASHPEAQSYAEDLDGLCRMLRDVKEIDPPQDLRDAILSGVRQSSAASAHKATLDIEENDGWLATLARTVRDWMRPQLAYGFAAGAAAAALVLSVLIGDSQFRLDETSLPGAMMPVESAAFSRVDSAQLEVGRARARVETKRFGDRVLGEIHVESQEPARIVLEFDGVNVSPQGFWRHSASSSPIDVQTGRIEFTHQGTNTYQVLLTDAGQARPEVRVQLRTDQGVAEQTLRIRPQD